MSVQGLEITRVAHVVREYVSRDKAVDKTLSRVIDMLPKDSSALSLSCSPPASGTEEGGREKFYRYAPGLADLLRFTEDKGVRPVDRLSGESVASSVSFVKASQQQKDMRPLVKSKERLPVPEFSPTTSSPANKKNKAKKADKSKRPVVSNTPSRSAMESDATTPVTMAKKRSKQRANPKESTEEITVRLSQLTA